ncbi:MAG: NAD(P)-dependent alcohol dehydrogenase [Bdellovibrionaceae bacterium]|nr:NAD(P)-dependent alcohol dehydrogenase [Pseudobdellovibrionaceae bacterium]
MKVEAFAAPSARSALQPWSYDPAPLGPEDIEIRISHCGICHSDIHLIDDDWKVSRYPLVPGHEIVGHVASVGPAVRHLRIGDRVGVGWLRGACLNCEACRRGEENLCPNGQATCVGAHGGFAQRIRVDGRFAFPIPTALKSENAAPLLCGGITVYAPLVNFEVRPSHRVGVIGIGGLGHLALQFAAKWGCEVTAFSSSKNKESEARRFGASHFINSSDAHQVARAKSSLDFIISTVHVDLDWVAYMNCLRPNGTLCFVGVPTKPISVPAFQLIGGQKSIVGSSTGGRPRIAEMLEFAARHGIEAQTEVIPLSDVNQAVDRVRSNQARYRMVLEMPK